MIHDSYGYKQASLMDILYVCKAKLDFFNSLTVNPLELKLTAELEYMVSNTKTTKGKHAVV